MVESSGSVANLSLYTSMWWFKPQLATKWFCDFKQVIQLFHQLLACDIIS